MENLDLLMREFSLLGNGWNGDFELILIDDSSPDGTGARAEDLGRLGGLRVRLMTRDAKRGMGSAIAEGVRASTGELVCVMDADLSHPPLVIPSLVAALDGVDGVDGVIASRYVFGGGIVSWPILRRVISFAARCVAGLLFDPPCLDPLSGFFLFRRSFIERVAILGLGNKPLLEILVAGRPAVREVPYQFRDRRNGESKLTPKDIMDFLRLLVILWRSARSNAPLGPPLETQSSTPRSSFPGKRSRAH